MEKKVIDGVREYYQLPFSVTDEQIEKEAKGSFGEACVNFGFAKDDLKKSLWKAIPKVLFRKIF